MLNTDYSAWKVFYIILPYSKSHARTGSIKCQCVVSNLEVDRHIYQTPGELGVWAGCPWPGQFIAPQHRTNRVPQGSPSYVGGQRPEVPLYLCCTPPGWAISTQAYRLRIARTSIASGHGGKQKTALAQWSTCSYCRYSIIKVHWEVETPLLTRTFGDDFLRLLEKFF